MERKVLNKQKANEAELLPKLIEQTDKFNKRLVEDNFVEFKGKKHYFDEAYKIGDNQRTNYADRIDNLQQKYRSEANRSLDDAKQLTQENTKAANRRELARKEAERIAKEEAERQAERQALRDSFNTKGKGASLPPSQATKNTSKGVGEFMKNHGGKVALGSSAAIGLGTLAYNHYKNKNK